MQEKSPQEYIFGIDGVRDEIVGLAGRRRFLFNRSDLEAVVVVV